MTIDDLTIGEARKLASMFSGQPATTETGYRIVVLQRGWVVVGEFSRSGDSVVITNASVIRIWGTTHGLGELAASGPTAKTVLDPCGTVRVHALCIVASLDSEKTKWTPKVSG